MNVSSLIVLLSILSVGMLIYEIMSLVGYEIMNLINVAAFLFIFFLHTGGLSCETIDVN